MKKLAALSLLALVTACASVPEPRNATPETPITFEAQSGATAEAFEGTFTVPENRDDPNSRMLTLHYVRFPATGQKPGAPIVYLAGGPGGSGIQTAKYDRFPLFMAMREFGDVIAFDQRGTGASDDLPICRSSETVSTTKPTSEDAYWAAQKRGFAECLDFWKGEGVDLRGWTTTQSVADLDDLRQHLGAKKISLWGISYGSHLSLAALKEMDSKLDRVVMMAIEGLDQTVKLPARSDAHFARLQDAIDQVPEAKAKYPDVEGLMRRVLAKLEAKPLMLYLQTRSGETMPYLLQKRDMQQLTGGLAADPARAGLLLGLYSAVDNGENGFLEQVMAQVFDPADTSVSFRPMTMLMDVASGTSPARKALIERQAQTAIVGPYLNFSLPLEEVDPSLVLGEDFRRRPRSRVPTLVLSGTLDGRTFPESGQEATAGLTRRQTVTITNGGHNSFMLSPEVTSTIEAFMRGENVDGREIIIDFPEL